MKRRQTYNAQALAIIMVVLVIASIIGFSVSSRLMTQKKSIIDERNSNEALEIADIILDNMLLSKPEEWAGVMEVGKTYIQNATNTIEGEYNPSYPEFLNPEEPDDTKPPSNESDPIKDPKEDDTKPPSSETDPIKDPKEPEIKTPSDGTEPIIKPPSNGTEPSKDPITQLLMKKAYAQGAGTSSISAITASLNHPLDFKEIGICPLTEGSSNQYTLKLSRTDDNTTFYLRPGETFTFPINGVNYGPNCKIEIKFPDDVDAKLGFVINTTYFKDDGSGDIKPYDYDHTTSYCFKNLGGVEGCGNTSFEKNWKQHNPKDTLELGINNSIDTIQLTSVSGESDLAFKYSMKNCNLNLQLWQLRASATCGDAYRAKEVIVPDVSPSFSIFNYVILNGLGELTTAAQ